MARAITCSISRAEEHFKNDEKKDFKNKDCIPSRIRQRYMVDWKLSKGPIKAYTHVYGIIIGTTNMNMSSVNLRAEDTLPSMGNLMH